MEEESYMAITKDGQSWAESETSVRFLHHAKTYTLFRRNPDNDSPFSIHFQFENRRFKRKLHTSDSLLAIQRAKLLIDRVISEHWSKITQPVLLPTPQASATSLARVIELYKEFATIAQRSVKNNILAMLKIVEKTSGKRRDAEKIDLSEINRPLVNAYQDLMVREYISKGITDEGLIRERRELALRTSRSTIGQARSIFSRNGDQDLPMRYMDAGLILPKSIDDFMSVKLRGSPSKSEYKIPNDELIQLTFREIEKLKDDKPVFLGFWLAAGGGLRRKEVRLCKWEYVIDRNGQLWVDGGIGKDNKRVTVPIQSRAAEQIRPFRKPEGWVIEERADRWCKRLCKWMRDLGWPSRLLIHEMRALVGSRIYSQSPVDAMRFLRHKSIKVTESNYVRYSTNVQPIEVL